MIPACRRYGDPAFALRAVVVHLISIVTLSASAPAGFTGMSALEGRQISHYRILRASDRAGWASCTRPKISRLAGVSR